MIVIKKKILVSTGIFMVIVLSLVIALSISLSSNGAPKYAINVVIDAGHGGVDSGTVGYSGTTKESDLNLEIAIKLGRYLDSSGIGVIYTRTDKGGLYGSEGQGFKRRDMLRRKEIINSSNADLVISVHMNAFPTHSRRGAQCFFNSSSEDGKLASSKIQQQFNTSINTRRAFEALKGDYYILNCSEIPSVIAECGFISNPEEETLLKTSEYQDKIAYSIYAGIIAYFDEITKLTWNEVTPDYFNA